MTSSFNNLSLNEKIMNTDVHRLRVLGLNLTVENAENMNKEELMKIFNEMAYNGDLTEDDLPIKYNFPDVWDDYTAARIVACLDNKEILQLLDNRKINYPLNKWGKFDAKEAKKELVRAISKNDFPIVFKTFAEKWAGADPVQKLSLHGLEKLQILAKNKKIAYENVPKNTLIATLTPLVNQYDYPICDESETF